MADLTAANIEVLRLLNRYRFLTNPQLLRLGLVRDNTSIYKILSRFGDGNRPYIGKKDFGFGGEASSSAATSSLPRYSSGSLPLSAVSAVVAPITR